MSRLAIGVPTFIKDPAFADDVEAFHHTTRSAVSSAPWSSTSSACAWDWRFAAALRQQF